MSTKAIEKESDRRFAAAMKAKEERDNLHNAAADLLADMKTGIQLARDVVNAWERGDLAGAVNALEEWADENQSIAKAEGRA